MRGGDITVSVAHCGPEEGLQDLALRSIIFHLLSCPLHLLVLLMLAPVVRKILGPVVRNEGLSLRTQGSRGDEAIHMLSHHKETGLLGLFSRIILQEMDIKSYQEDIKKIPSLDRRQCMYIL